MLVSNGFSSCFVQKITNARTLPRGEPVAEFKSTTILSYVQGVSELLRRCLEQHVQGIRTVFKSDTTLRSHLYLVRSKDTDPAKQYSIVYRIPCKCGIFYIGETGRPMQESINEQDRDIRLARTQTSVVSEHAHEIGHYPIWNEVKFIDRDPHWYTRRVNEAIHIGLYTNNINRMEEFEFPEAWMPTIKIHNNWRTVQQRTAGGTATRRNNGTMGVLKCTNHSWSSWYKWCRAISRPHRLKKTSRKQLKRRDLHLKWLHRETNDTTVYQKQIYSFSEKFWKLPPASLNSVIFIWMRKER